MIGCSFKKRICELNVVESPRIQIQPYDQPVHGQKPSVLEMLRGMLDYIRFIIVPVANWINSDQQKIIDYLIDKSECTENISKNKDSDLLKLKPPPLEAVVDLMCSAGKENHRAIRWNCYAYTLLRWFRKLVATKYDGGVKRGSGRPRIRHGITDLTVQTANENPSCGYRRISDPLFNLGITVSRNTVKRILKDHGIEPG